MALDNTKLGLRMLEMPAKFRNEESWNEDERKF